MIVLALWEGNHATIAGEMTKPSLLDLKALLRSRSSAARRELRFSAAELASGYHELLSTAPRRALPYFSLTRDGRPPVEPTGRRKEERLAMAWFNAGTIQLEGGDQFEILDYQFPLKSMMANTGIGKIDLLGRCAVDGCLVVIELKVEGNAEDRRIGLLEGLIYAAIVESNAAAIVHQLAEVKGHRVTSARPKSYSSLRRNTGCRDIHP